MWLFIMVTWSRLFPLLNKLNTSMKRSVSRGRWWKREEERSFTSVNMVWSDVQWNRRGENRGSCLRQYLSSFWLLFFSQSEQALNNLRLYSLACDAVSPTAEALIETEETILFNFWLLCGKRTYCTRLQKSRQFFL